MPSVVQERLGVWGETTASIDWCETNYEVTVYVAEFWNTISNLSMIIPPLYGVWNARKYALETRFFVSHLSLLLVGIGSTMFHMTLKYPMQLLDELPMIYGSCVFIYCMAQVKSGPRDRAVWLVSALVFYAVFFTAIYSVWQNPLVHEFANGLLIAALFVQAFMLLKTDFDPGCAKLFALGSLFYALAFLIWNIDNHFCSHLQDFRAVNPLGVGVLTQFHAFWHILAGYATYLHILFSTHYRLSYLQRKPEFKPCLVGIEVVKGVNP